MAESLTERVRALQAAARAAGATEKTTPDNDILLQAYKDNGNRFYGEEKPRILFIYEYSDDFIRHFYATNPFLSVEPYDGQLQAVLKARFGGEDSYADVMKKHGWNAAEIIANAAHLQKAWATKNKYEKQGFYEIIFQQVLQFKPNAIYFDGAMSYDENFIKELKKHVRIIAGNETSELQDLLDIKFSVMPDAGEIDTRLRAAIATEATQPTSAATTAAIAAPPPFGNLTICTIYCDEHAHYLPHWYYSIMPLLEGGASTAIVKTVRGEAEKAAVVNTDEYSTAAEYTYAGIFDYGKAKNVCLDMVLTEWVLFLDADERLCLDPEAVLEVLNTPDADAAYCKIHSVFNRKDFVEKIELQSQHEIQQDSIEPNIRMFKPNIHRADGNHEINRFRFSVGIHEQVKPSLVANNAKICDSSVRIFHVGYKNPSHNFIKSMQRIKGIADYLEKNQDTTDPTTLYNLWALFQEIGGSDMEKIREQVNKSFKVMPGTIRL